MTAHNHSSGPPTAPMPSHVSPLGYARLGRRSSAQRREAALASEPVTRTSCHKMVDTWRGFWLKKTYSWQPIRAPKRASGAVRAGVKNLIRPVDHRHASRPGMRFGYSSTIGARHMSAAKKLAADGARFDALRASALRARLHRSNGGGLVTASWLKVSKRRQCRP